MREAIDGIATLKEVDEQTFVRFCEYAYMGDYTPAQKQIVLPNTRTDHEEFRTECYCEERAFSAHKKNKKKKGGLMFVDDDIHVEPCVRCSLETPTQKLWDEFQCRVYSVVSPKFRPCEEFEADSGPFLCHARVYVFADMYDIPDLCSLALDKLHHALCAFEVVSDGMEEVIDLARFSYCNENTRDNEPRRDMDDLRRMVVHFVVCVFGKIVKDDKFLGMMEEGGCFARDLTGLLGERIITSAN
ncbi:uncharacterized protein RAG0_03135 [Rhynchosporium agropyri]|uniref:BTB domain-containing protein n=1 Tax=Rhynchosporium agropyri TaxID=914238 RepID=A0A1E1K376_9HELO|nr:uncharacterized protein RAG0_03135 [Rhynchosporium agropyri]